MKYTIYHRSYPLSYDIYIGCTTNIKSRTATHLKSHPHTIIKPLVTFECNTKAQAELIEAAFIKAYATENISKIGNSAYSQGKQAQARRSNALKGKLSKARMCAYITPQGVHKIFHSQTAMAQHMGIPTNTLNDWMNDRLDRFKTTRAKHTEVYYADDPREDNIFVQQFREFFGD